MSSQNLIDEKRDALSYWIVIATLLFCCAAGFAASLGLSMMAGLLIVRERGLSIPTPYATPYQSLATRAPTLTQRALTPTPVTPTRTPPSPAPTTTSILGPLIENGTLLYVTDGYPIDFAWSEDGNHLIIASSNYFGPGNLVEIDVPQGTIVREDSVVSMNSGPFGCIGSFNPDASQVAFAAGYSRSTDLRIWDVQQRHTLQVLHGDQDEILCVAWSPDGRTVATSSASQLIFWDTESWTAYTVYSVQYNRVAESIAWSPDGGLIALGMPDGIDVWDATTQRVLRTLHGPTASSHSVAFSPDGRWIAAGDISGHVWIWDVTGGPAVNTFEAGSSVRAVEWSPDGSRIAVGTLFSQVYVWEVSTGELIGAIADTSGGLNVLTWSPDGTRLITGARSVTIWLVPDLAD